jgi:hypothetical protein
MSRKKLGRPEKFLLPTLNQGIEGGIRRKFARL